MENAYCPVFYTHRRFSFANATKEKRKKKGNYTHLPVK
jgi:hypothetical protein